MNKGLSRSRDFRLGEWLVRPQRNLIESGHVEKHLEGKVMGVLIHLADHARAVVSKGDLLDAVWPNQDVADGVLTRAIYELRRALDDDAGDPRYIENVPRLGYRLLERPAPSDKDAAPSSPQLRRKLRTVSAALAILLLSMLAFQLVFRSPGTPIRSVAVLPFVNMTGDAGKNFVSDGLSEEVIHVLAQQPALAVSARTSSFALRDRGLTARDIARRLGVDSIIEGSIREERGLQRITVQLIDVRSDSHRGSTTFDVVDGNLFDAQARLADVVVRLLEGAGADVLHVDTDSFDGTDFRAYELYLRGRAALQTRSAESLRSARELLLEAVRIDNEFAPAHASLAQLYLVSRAYLGLAPAESRNLAGESISNALALDPNNVEALVVSAALASDSRNYDESQRLFTRAIELQPSFALAHVWRGEALHDLGYLSAAGANIERGLLLDPLSGSTNTVMAKAASYFPDDDRLFAAADQAQTFEARFAPRLLSLHYFRQGDIPAFARELRRYYDVIGISPVAADLLVRAARKEVELHALPALLEPHSSRVNNYFARELAMLGHHSAALDALLRWPRSEGTFISDVWLPEFREVRALPGFRELVRSLGVDDYWRVHGPPDVCKDSLPEPFCDLATAASGSSPAAE